MINLASVSGKRPLARRTPYTASKMAVIGLTATLAHEVGPLGVVVNSLSPGPVKGPRMTRNFTREAERTGTTPAEAEREFVSRAALQRMVTEDEVAAAVVAMLQHARPVRRRHRPVGRDDRPLSAASPLNLLRAFQHFPACRPLLRPLALRFQKLAGSLPTRVSPVRYQRDDLDLLRQSPAELATRRKVVKRA